MKNNKSDLKKPVLVVVMAVLVAGLVASTLTTLPAFAMNCLNCHPRDGGPAIPDPPNKVHGCGWGIFGIITHSSYC
jgi:hypothetical protein